MSVSGWSTLKKCSAHLSSFAYLKMSLPLWHTSIPWFSSPRNVNTSSVAEDSGLMLEEKGCVLQDVVVVVVWSPHISPRCWVWRVETSWKLWLPTVSVGDPAAKRQLPFGSLAGRHFFLRKSVEDNARSWLSHILCIPVEEKPLGPVAGSAEPCDEGSCSEWKLPLRGRIIYRQCRRPKFLKFLYSTNCFFGGGAFDAGTAAQTSASVCRRYQNVPWTALDYNTH